MSAQPVTPQKKSMLPRLLIGCGVLVLLSLPVCGIISAIAIPAFQRSINKSKQSEAEGIVRRLSDQARASWMSEACRFPEELPPTGTLAQASHGNKYSPTIPEPFRQDMGVGSGDQLYFVYSTTLQDDGSQPTYIITAQADFDGDGQVFHTLTSRIQGLKDESGSCEALIAPTVTTNEFQ